MRMMKMHIKEEECAKCHKALKPSQQVWIEMCTCWKVFGLCGNKDEKHSQGYHAFGKDCAKQMGVKIIKQKIEWSENEFDLIGVLKQKNTRVRTWKKK